MKKNLKFKSIMILLCAALLSVSCDKSKNEEPAPPQGETLDLGDGSDAFELKSDMTLKYPNTYNLKGWVYVVDGVTLTIEPGVIIKGQKSTKATLIVERGGKIMAQGTKERPIVFTSAQPAGSRKPGDWGGIILLGKAKNNMGEQSIEGGVRSAHGGNNDADNSGVLSYVRCEFAGVEYSTDNEINGITFGSIGSGTQIDHVQVSYAGDDSFEWFGGCVNAKYLVAFRGWDDDFDTDNGFSGKIQFALGLRDPKIGDKSASNSFESDNNANGAVLPETNPLFTNCVFANVSLFGPVKNVQNYTSEAGDGGSAVDARFQAALHLRRHTKLNIFNSVVAAYPIGLIIENSNRGDAQGNATSGELNVTNCVIAGCIKNFQDKQVWANNSQYDDVEAGQTFVHGYFNRTDGGNRTFTAISDLNLSGDPLNLTNPVVFPAASSPLATGATWTHSKVSSWFEKVNYIGAFGTTETASNNWTVGWTNFDPQNTVY
jgi:hypothetical protein